jgi:hypothetical protein
MPLVTLRDAALYIAKLPKVEQQASEWQTAAEVLIVIGEHGGDPMFARIAMIKRGIDMSRTRPCPAPASLLGLPSISHLASHPCRLRVESQCKSGNRYTSDRLPLHG